MKKLFFIAFVFLISCSDNQNEVSVEKLSDDMVNAEHLYEPEISTTIESIKFKVLNSKGIKFLNLKEQNLSEGEYYAVMELTLQENLDAPKGMSTNFGYSLSNTGVQFDLIENDRTYTSSKILRYRPSIQEPASKIGKITGWKIGCKSIDIIYNGDKCGPSYVCNDFVGWCTCFQNCYFEINSD